MGYSERADSRLLPCLCISSLPSSGFAELRTASVPMLVVSLVLLYAFFRAMVATFQFHRLLKAPADTPGTDGQSLVSPGSQGNGENKGRNSTPAIATGLLFAAVLTHQVVKAVLSPPTLETQIAKMSEKMNKDLPKTTVDGATRLDRTIAGPGKQLSFHSTMLEAHEAEDITPEWRQRIEAGIRTKATAASELVSLRKAGTTLIYVFHLTNGKEAIRVTIPPL